MDKALKNKLNMFRIQGYDSKLKKYIIKNYGTGEVRAVFPDDIEYCMVEQGGSGKGSVKKEPSKRKKV
jgi:hypothetical protein